MVFQAVAVVLLGGRYDIPGHYDSAASVCDQQGKTVRWLPWCCLVDPVVLLGS